MQTPVIGKNGITFGVVFCVQYRAISLNYIYVVLPTLKKVQASRLLVDSIEMEVGSLIVELDA